MRDDLDLDEQPRVDQRGHLDHGGGRQDLAEGQPVGLAGLRPPGDVGDVDPGLHDVREAGAELLERRAEFSSACSVCFAVALEDDLAVRIEVHPLTKMKSPAATALE